MTRWTTADIPDLSGRTIVVTGANSGLGLSTAKELAAKGAHVVMACRNATKAASAEAQIRADHPSATTEVRSLDLSDLDSVREFATGLEQPIDVLINNAGVMAVPEGRTKQGFEMQFGTNVLGHFLLTSLLFPQVNDRVVWLSSQMHRLGKIDLDDLNWRKRKYRAWPAYGQTKLADLMLGYELDRKLRAANSAKKSLIAHPGYASTNLQGKTDTIFDPLMALGNKLPFLAQPAWRGAYPSLYAATDPQLPSGTYVGPDGPGEMQGYPKPVQSNKRSHDLHVAAELWAKCEDLVGQPFSV